MSSEILNNLIRSLFLAPYNSSLSMSGKSTKSNHKFEGAIDEYASQFSSVGWGCIFELFPEQFYQKIIRKAKNILGLNECTLLKELKQIRDGTPAKLKIFPLKK